MLQGAFAPDQWMASARYTPDSLHFTFLPALQRACKFCNGRVMLTPDTLMKHSLFLRIIQQQPASSAAKHAFDLPLATPISYGNYCSSGTNANSFRPMLLMLDGQPWVLYESTYILACEITL